MSDRALLQSGAGDGRWWPGSRMGVMVNADCAGTDHREGLMSDSRANEGAAKACSTNQFRVSTAAARECTCASDSRTSIALVHPAQPFLDARESLLAHRSWYDDAYRGLRWPVLHGSTGCSTESTAMRPTTAARALAHSRSRARGTALVRRRAGSQQPHRQPAPPPRRPSRRPTPAHASPTWLRSGRRCSAR